MSDPKLLDIIEFVCHAQQLESLTIECASPQSRIHIAAFVQSVPKCVSLQNLTLQNVHIGKELVPAFMKHARCMQRLTLHDSFITKEEATFFGSFERRAQFNRP